MKPWLLFPVLLILSAPSHALEPMAEEEMQTVIGQAGVALELGMDLNTGRSILKDSGCYERWVVEVLGISTSTGSNYRRLADWYSKDKATVNAWKTLGPTKLYELLSLPSR